MGMCCFDVTRSLTVAGRLWSKDVNRTKTITADIVSSNVRKAKNILTDVSNVVADLGNTFRAPQMLYA